MADEIVEEVDPVEATKNRMFEELLKGVDNMDILPLRKKLIKNRLENRPHIKQAVMDKLTAQALGVGAIAYNGVDGFDVDWGKFAELVKEWLPTLLKLITLFF